MTWVFCPTFSPEVKKLAGNFLRNPVLVEVARENATADTVEQIVYQVHDSEKTDVLIDILKGDGEDGGPIKQVIVFVNAKITCRRLASTLSRVGISADAIHGDKTQEERMAALEAFKKGEIEVLVATDVAARGLDIAELPVVINYDVPFGAEDYVHRIGRTGRAGSKGKAVMLATGGDSRLVTAIEELTKQKFKPEERHPFDTALSVATVPEKIVLAAAARIGEMKIAKVAVRWICRRCRLLFTIRFLMRRMNRQKVRRNLMLIAISWFALKHKARKKAWSLCFSAV